MLLQSHLQALFGLPSVNLVETVVYRICHVELYSEGSVLLTLVREQRVGHQTIKFQIVIRSEHLIMISNLTV